MNIRLITLLAVVILLASSLQIPAAVSNSTPSIVISVQDYMPGGKPRQFPGSGGTVQWSPSSPVIKGDRLQVTYGMSNNISLRDVRVTLDNKPLARLVSPPWRLTLDTAGLAPGKHTLKAEVRTRTNPIMYGFNTYQFNVQTTPVTQVLGTTEELNASTAQANTGRGPATIDSSIRVKLRSLDPAADRLFPTGQRIVVDKPVVIYLESPVDQWAYLITRGDTEVASGGPMPKNTYIELAAKSDGLGGLDPGELTLTVWGISSSGAYSQPIVVPLLVEQEGQQ